MDNPTVRAVHRISLTTDRTGQITAGALVGAEPLPHGAVVVLDAGDGWWMRASEIEHLAHVLDYVAHVTVTGTSSRYRHGPDALGVYCGIRAIADRISELLCHPRLFDPV